MIPRFTSRFATVTLAAAFILVLAVVSAAHKALTDADRAQADLDAEVSAGLVGSYLHRHAEALSSMHGVYLVADPVRDPGEFAALVGAMGAHVNGFRRVFLTDSAGRVRYDSIVAPPAKPLPPGLVLDTMQLLRIGALTRRARETGQTLVSAPGVFFASPADSGFVLIEPLHIEGRFVGFAVGEVTTRSVLRSLSPRHARDRLDLKVRTGPPGAPGALDVATIRNGPAPERMHPDSLAASVQPASAVVSLPGGGQWTVEVMHAGSGPLRTTLWGMGILTLSALALGVMHERRQARRIAERSAELERLSSELLSANRAKSEFLANVSHELRTPLNAIVGFADLLRDGVYGELAPRQVSPVQRIEASANHLRHLVDQVLDLAKIAAGRLEVHTETVDLRPFVLDVASEVEPLINEKQLALSIAVGATLPRIRTDPQHLRQILVNLLGNAVKYTATGGIAVRARLVEPGAPLTGGPPIGKPPSADAHWVALQVSDTGAGVPKADRERIFDEFEQVNAGPRGDSMARGTGLGLPISRRLARLIGGDVTLESELGRGSTFTLWLPVDPADLKPRVSARMRAVTPAPEVVTETTPATTPDEKPVVG